jgi:5'-deoxynucleotidase YfbR-like HD superfamily hydrolase
MKNNLDFLIEIQKLKEMPRTGWVLMKVKNPETIAEHIFQVTFFGWLLGKEKKLEC